MIRPALLHIVRALVVLLALTGAAAAQSERPALRASVTVTSNVVRIGDLIDNAGAVADVPIFRSPDLGTQGAVATERVIEAIRPHHLIDIDTRGLAQVVVIRLGRAITAEEISARIAQALSAQYRLGNVSDISLAFDRSVRAMEVDPTATGELQVLALNYDPRTGRFDVTLDLPSSPEIHQRPPRFTGTAIETVETVAVNRPVEHGEILKASDLTTLRRPKSQSASAITDLAAAVGMAARHQLRPGQPLAATDLMKPEIVQRNDMVTLVYDAPGIMLTLRGQAQEAGALGDTIRVLNAESKRVVQGVVTGPDRVTVSGAITPRLASATEPGRSVVVEPARGDE